MEIKLAFGRSGLPVQLPEGYRYQVLEARSAISLEDAPAAITRALDFPIGCAPLSELARGKRSAAISVCDITRPAPNSTVLPVLLPRLEAAGIPREGITILIATGLHRPATDSEILQIVGPEVAAHYRVVNHFARNLSDHQFLGDTASGTPVYVDRRFTSAELRLTLGFVEPHLMLGYSGGRKLVAPGLAAQETIKVLHSSKFMRDGRATEGSISDNPLHRELLEIARMAGHDFIVDVALSRSRQIAQVFAGDPVQAHARGMEFVSEVMLEVLDEPVDAVITTSAGYPLDLTYYQAIKGVTAAAHVVKRGGRILLIAECAEGVGAHEFSDMVKQHRTADGFMRSIEGVPVTVDQWQIEKLALVQERADLLFYLPGLPPDYYSSLWGPIFASPELAIAALLEGLPPNARVAVIPEGPYVLARAHSENFTAPAYPVISR